MRTFQTFIDGERISPDSREAIAALNRAMAARSIWFRSLLTMILTESQLQQTGHPTLGRSLRPTKALRCR